jgi:hypothetical protein
MLMALVLLLLALLFMFPIVLTAPSAPSLPPALNAPGVAPRAAPRTSPRAVDETTADEFLQLTFWTVQSGQSTAQAFPEYIATSHTTSSNAT